MGNVVLKPSNSTKLPQRRGGHHIVHTTQNGGGESPRRKKKKKSKLLQGAFITVGAMALTVLVIHASDSFKNPGTLIAGVGESA